MESVCVVAEISEFVVVGKCVGPVLCREFLSALFLLDLIASNVCHLFEGICLHRIVGKPCLNVDKFKLYRAIESCFMVQA